MLEIIAFLNILFLLKPVAEVDISKETQAYLVMTRQSVYLLYLIASTDNIYIYLVNMALSVLNEMHSMYVFDVQPSLTLKGLMLLLPLVSFFLKRAKVTFVQGMMEIKYASHRELIKDEPSPSFKIRKE